MSGGRRPKDLSHKPVLVRDPSEDFAKDICARSAESEQSRRDLVDLAVNGGWGVDRKDADGVTALYGASVIACDLFAVEKLLKGGANPHLACHYRHVGIELLRVHFCDLAWERYLPVRMRLRSSAAERGEWSAVGPVALELAEAIHELLEAPPEPLEPSPRPAKEPSSVVNAASAAPLPEGSPSVPDLTSSSLLHFERLSRTLPLLTSSDETGALASQRTDAELLLDEGASPSIPSSSAHEAIPLSHDATAESSVLGDSTAIDDADSTRAPMVVVRRGGAVILPYLPLESTDASFADLPTESPQVAATPVPRASLSQEVILGADSPKPKRSGLARKLMKQKESVLRLSKSRHTGEPLYRSPPAKKLEYAPDRVDDDSHRVVPSLSTQVHLVGLGGILPGQALDCLLFLLKGGVDADLVKPVGESQTSLVESKLLARALSEHHKRQRPTPQSSEEAMKAFPGDEAAMSKQIPPARFLRMPPLREKGLPADESASAVGGLPSIPLLRKWCERMFLAAADQPDHLARARMVNLCARFKTLNPNAQDPIAKGRTPLQWACVAGDGQGVDFLLNVGSDPSLQEPVTGLSCLGLAVLCPDPPSREAMVRAFAQDDARRLKATKEPWKTAETLSSDHFWTDMLLQPGETKPLAADAPRTSFAAALIPPGVAASDCAAVCSCLQDPSQTSLTEEECVRVSTAVSCLVDGFASGRIRRSPSTLLRLATARRLFMVRAELKPCDPRLVPDDQRGDEDGEWSGFSLLHAAAVMTTRVLDDFEDKSVVLILQRLHAQGGAFRACRVVDGCGLTPAGAMKESLTWMREHFPTRSGMSADWSWKLWRLLAEFEQGKLSPGSVEIMRTVK
jgi:hypothetical protein